MEEKIEQLEKAVAILKTSVQDCVQEAKGKEPSLLVNLDNINRFIFRIEDEINGIGRT